MRLLTIGHSYIVEQNRCLGHEMARQGEGRWEVTIAAPSSMRGEPHARTLSVRGDEPCRVQPLPLRFSASPHLRWYGGSLRALLRQPWDVVHIWQEPYVLASAQIAACAPRSARVVPATFQNIAKTYPAPVRLIESRVMARADGWIAFAETAHEVQRARPGYRARPACVIPPGIDPLACRLDPEARRLVRRRLGIGPDANVIGFVGRFVPEKGLPMLLRALDGLPDRTHALFVGRGPLEDRLRRFAASHPGRVHVVTDAAHDQVPACLNAMDVLCAPSQTTVRWREQFGRMLIEAMACGVPVAASLSGEIPHVVGDAGVLLPEDDVDAWRGAIAALLEDRRRRADLRDRGLARAAARFTWPAVGRAHLSFFESLLAGPCA